MVLTSRQTAQSFVCRIATRMSNQIDSLWLGRHNGWAARDLAGDARQLLLLYDFGHCVGALRLGVGG